MALNGSQPNSGMFSLNEFQNRGVIKLAPDALVYIGGSLSMQIVAPLANSNNKVSFDDGISSISVQNVLDPPGSSTATIEIVTPVYGERSKYWVPFATLDGVIRAPLFVPMMEVKVYFKGRFLVNESPQYYPAFWGFITNVEESYSGGLHKIILQCGDILHWWSFITLTIHPVPDSNIASGGIQKLTVYSTVFDRDNPFTIIYKLMNGIGFSEFVAPTWLAQMTPLRTIYPPDQFKTVVTGLMDYWQGRITKNLGNLLKMYGVMGEKLTGTITDRDGKVISSYVGLNPTEDSQKPSNKKSQSQASTATVANVKGFKLSDMLSHFTVFFDFEKMGKFDQAETMSKLDVAIEVKTRSEYEFFQDTNGNFVFKPPFYNMDVRGIKPYEIESSDILNFSLGTNSDSIVTALQVHTAAFEQIRQMAFARGEGYHLDIELAKRYGFRFKEINVEYISDKRLARQMAVAQMNMINSKAISGSVTVPGRPEMRLGYPIYIKHRDSFHYVKSMSHSFDYGSGFTTTIAFETERKRMYDFDGQAYSPLADKIYKFSGLLLPSNTDGKPTTKDDELTADELKKQELLASQGRIASLKLGRYTIQPTDSTAQWAITDDTIPLTDSDGYKVIGAFPYGRGMNPVSIDSDTVGYQYSKATFAITSMAVGSLKESDQMGKSFVAGEEGIVPGYLASSIVAGKESIAAPPGAKLVNQGVQTDVDTPSQQLPAPLPTAPASTNTPTVIAPTGTQGSGINSKVMVNGIGLPSSNQPVVATTYEIE